jgi:hypothetical protein
MVKVRYLLLGLFACFEAANFTGVSWVHLRRLSDEELIDAAIRYDYARVYSNLAEFKADYPSFTPEVHYWADLTGEAGNQFFNKFVGFTRFNVRLPEEVVVVATNGEALFSRRCSSSNWCSPTVPPDRPRLGIVGTVQNGPPNYDASQDFSVQWVDGSEGSVFIAGHCFAAFSQSQKPTLRISGANNGDVINIGDQYGYRLVAIKEWGGYSSLKISQQEFTRSKTCDRALRAAWPNVGGASWIR